MAQGRGTWSPLVPALHEFAVHGVRCVWPAVLGTVKRGIPTSFGAAPLIYRTAPDAALADPALHRLLALLDALRTGRARERMLAADLLKRELEGARAA